MIMEELIDWSIEYRMQSDGQMVHLKIGGVQVNGLVF